MALASTTSHEPKQVAEEMRIQDGLFISAIISHYEPVPPTPKKQFLLSDYLGQLDVEFYKTIECESGFQHEGLFGDNGRAYGILQFHRPTFDSFCKGDYYNLEDQLQCGAKMFSLGLQHHWTCWTKLYGV